MHRSVIVDDTDVQNIIKTVSELQEEADRVTEESTPAEIKEAFHKHGEAQGYIRCLRDSKLVLVSDYGRLLMRNTRIGEKIKALKKL
ncbi:hypothetical protein Ana3638_11755 [Anaerocolumna sedimenticola]|uniref:Uncharacterized protein n=1 Tax=Anaerocolumna sedimenticola TaxID=2696063 RepID=A0A6P1TJT5_9FIRM|nr:hypothetical protein [Anaerocolumna sedimenticola]QHQ61364.1 hypothetical protein Ana3638_11755 [Anaerocolumna sedimenticola]